VLILAALPKAFTAPQALAENYPPLAHLGDGEAGMRPWPICQRSQLARPCPGLCSGCVVAADTSVAEPVPASTQRKQPRPKQGKTPRFSEGLRH
jgi:hypothetical protein